MPILARHVVLETRSVAVARGDASMFRGISDFTAAGNLADFRLRIAAATCDDVRINAVASSGHAISLVEDDGITLLMPYRGRIAAQTGATTMQARSGGMIVPHRGARRTVVGPHYLGLAVQVTAERLHRRARQNPDDARVLARVLDGGLDGAGPGVGALMRYLRYLVAEIDAAGARAPTPRAARSAADMLTGLLVDCFDALAPTPPRPAAAGRRHVERAEDAIRARLAEDLSVPALAAELGIGTRALQLAFQAHRGLAPREVIAAVRLDAAQARLRAGAPSETVTSIALDCGVTHLGRFAARYRERFGEAPSLTLVRAQRRA